MNHETLGCRQAEPQARRSAMFSCVAQGSCSHRIVGMGHVEHQAVGPRSVRCFVLTVSDSRTAETDTSGNAIVELLAAAGHHVAGRAIVSDSTSAVRSVIE